MFDRILLAFKFTAAGRLALDKAVQLAKEHGSELRIFHALDYRLKELDRSDPKLTEIIAQTEDRFESELKPLLNGFDNAQFGCSPADPAMEVCKIARYVNADLIIVGSHQLPEKTCLARVDYVGMTILEKAPCPVMLVPHCK
ncbi:MAG: universal stress protein [Desulfobacterales bacterium]|nr:MAG: universal stress protein [Desulfobacterales bacterium]